MSASLSNTEWFKSRLEAVYAAKDEDARNAALDAILAPNIQVQHNDETLDAAQKRSQMLATTAAAAHVDIKWENLVETSPGELEGTYVLTVSSKFRVRAGPVQRFMTVNFTATVANVGDDTTTTTDADADSDPRRVVQLKEQEDVKVAPIHLQSIPHDE